MRFMMLMIPKGYEKAEPGAMPDAKAVAAMMKYNDGLHPPSIESMSRCPASDNEVIEVRQVQEFSDFPADVQKAAAGFEEMQAHAEQPWKS